MKRSSSKPALAPAEYACLDGVGLAELVTRREISIPELMASARAAIDRANPTVNAIIEIYEDRFDDPETGLMNGPLKGVPFLIKDVTAHFGGRKLEYASRLCEGYVVPEDDHYATMVKGTGVNLVGRSHTPEFSMALCADSVLYGATSNPWKRGYSTSGSSGGAAAAVASGMVPIAHASDLGGSTRGPAAWCGTVGLHPSRGRVSQGPAFDERSNGMSQSSVVTRTMRDTAVMLDALSAPQPGDPFIIRRPERPYTSLLNGTDRKLKIGWSAGPLMDAPVDPEIAAAVEATAKALAGLGHHVEESSPIFDLVDMDRMLTELWYFQFDKYLDGLGARSGRSRAGTVERATLAFYEFAKSRSVEAYFAAVEKLSFSVARSAGGLRATTSGSPTCAQVAQPNGVYGMNIDVPPLEFLQHEQRPCQFMVWVNVCGVPAISLPLGQHTNGLPIGVQCRVQAMRNTSSVLAPSWRTMPGGTNPPLHEPDDGSDRPRVKDVTGPDTQAGQFQTEHGH
ncbi:MAG: amidase [Hyphomicrobiaceae bacterium]